MSNPKKYITINHPDLKDGVEFETDLTNFRVINRLYDINSCIKNDLIKELQEPIWTDDDMIEFAKYAHDSIYTHSINESFQKFKKEKNR